MRRFRALLLLLPFLPFARGMLSAAPAQRTARYQSAHFILTAPAGGDVGRLLDELESAYRDVQRYGLRMPARVEARSHGSTADFAIAAGVARFNLAAAVGARIELQPMSVLLRRGELTRALRHELTHVALAEAARRGLPRWLNEGMAMMVAGEMQPERITFVRLDRLEDSLAGARLQPTIRSAYGTARRLASRLIESVGQGSVLSFLGSVGSSGGFEEKFRGLTGKGSAEWGRAELGRR
ncbi:MAG: hypothetical protein JWQ98_2914 [Chlorobi bacterium]|nr:hypothetical protein [Chlorobiota bacterium]